MARAEGRAARLGTGANLLRAGPLLLVLAACAPGGGAAQRAAELPADYLPCKSARPQICTRDYRPVCAQRDTGTRCVTQPCPSAEWVTYPNACSACSDEKVLGHRPGACD